MKSKARKRKPQIVSRETDTVRAILEFLDARRLVAERINSGMAFASYTRKSDGKTKGRVIRGARPGTADILGCLPGGRFLAIEVKWLGGYTKPGRAVLQQNFRERVIALGGIAVQVTSVEEVRDLLDSAKARA